MVSSWLALSIYHQVLLAFLSAVLGFLPSLHGRSVAVSSCSMVLASLSGPGELFPGLSLFCAFGLPLFGSLPSCPVPQVSLPPGGCLLPWASSSAVCVLASSSGTRSCVSGFSSSCLGFQDVSLVFSFRDLLLPFLPSRGLLRCQGTLSALCLAPCQVFGGFWVLSAGRAPSFSCPCFTVSLARPASVSLRPRAPFRSLFRATLRSSSRCPFYCFLVFLFGSFFLFCAFSIEPSWCVCRCGLVAVCVSCFLVLSSGCCLLVFLLVFTSCYPFVVLFSSWHGFSGVLWCRLVL